MPAPPHPACPNIIFICTDQQRYDSLGCTGNPHAVTPHLDELAEDPRTTKYPRFFSNNPVCMPSRASMLTGCLPSRHGVGSNGIPLANRDYPRLTPSSESEAAYRSHLLTLPEWLKRHGYHTRSVGKLHLTPTQAPRELGFPESNACWQAGEFRGWHGPYFGFDQVDLTLGHGDFVGGHYLEELRAEAPEIAALRGVRDRTHPLRELPSLWFGRVPEPLHHSSWVARKACGFLRSRQAKEQPFFYWVGFPDPHVPFAPPAAVAEDFLAHDFLPPSAVPGDLEGKPSLWKGDGPKRVPAHPEAIPLLRRFTDAQIHLIDQAVGRLVRTLKEEGLWENTILVFTSDHGDFLGEFGLFLKTNLACAALNRVPLLVRNPRASGGGVFDSVASGVDLFPTLCGMAGLPAPEGIDGQSLVESASTERHALIQCLGAVPAGQRNFSLCTDRHRLTWFPDSDEWEFYDHLADPYERQNRYPLERDTAELHDLRNQLYRSHARAMVHDAGRCSSC